MLTTLLCLTLMPASASVSVELRSQVELLSQYYSMADVARIRCADSSSCQKLKSLRIGKTPRPGYWGQISRRDIQARVRAKLPGQAKALEWSGADVVRVQALGVALDGDRLIATAEAVLGKHLAATFTDFKIKSVQQPDALQVPEGKLELVGKLDSSRGLSPRMPVWVDVQVDGQHYQSVPVWFAVSAMEKVLLARSDIAVKAEITADDFIEAYRDVTLVRGDFFNHAEELSGLRINRTLAGGAILKQSDVEWVPPVTRGEEVMVHATAGAVSIKTRAVAMNDGDLFQRIKVKSPAGYASFNAVVIGNGQVRVE